MSNIKEKAKNYWKEHKYDIITIGTGKVTMITGGDHYE